MSQLRILLVPDYLTWILGTWAKQIVRTGTQHDYYFFPQQMLPYYYEEYQTLVEGVDLIHILSDFDFDKLVLPPNVPTIGSIHHVTNWDKLVPITKQTDALMVVANEWKEFLCQKGISEERIRLFNNGVDSSIFYPVSDKVLARKQLGIHSDTPLIGYSSKYTSNTDGRKGVHVLLKALKKLASTDKTFGVLITGPGWKKVVEEIKGYGISEVYYYPFLPDRMMPICYNALDLYVVTSKIEGGPVPLLNCMACGIPTVSTPVGLVKDYIQDGVNGMIVPKEDAEATSQAILHLLDSPQLQEKISQAGLKTIQNHLTWEKALNGIEQFYQQVWEAKIDKRDPKKLELEPLKQRQRVLNIDSYLWNLKLLTKGHPKEGLRGIGENGLGVVVQETPKVFMTEMLASLQK